MTLENNMRNKFNWLLILVLLALIFNLWSCKIKNKAIDKAEEISRVESLGKFSLTKEIKSQSKIYRVGEYQYLTVESKENALPTAIITADDTLEFTNAKISWGAKIQNDSANHKGNNRLHETGILDIKKTNHSKKLIKNKESKGLQAGAYIFLGLLVAIIIIFRAAGFNPFK